MTTHNAGARGHPSEINSPTGASFSITNAKLYVPITTLSTEDDNKLLQQLKIRFKRTVIWSNSAANKGQLTVNYCQLSVFDCSYLSCNDHRDRWVFQEIFFVIIF